MKKTLLFHDTFLTKGGAERMNIEIAKILDADIATAVWAKECYDARVMGFTGKIFEVDPGFRRGMIGFMMMKLSFVLSPFLKKDGLNLKDYGTLFLSNEAISSIWSIPKDIETYYYAHSISRHLFDQYDVYLSKVPKALKPVYKFFASILKKIYIAEIKKIGRVFVNSIKNQERMRDWIGRSDAIILYPPVNTEKFSPKDEMNISQIFATEGISLSYKDYYLSFSRLTHAKRVDAIIEAFGKIPEKKLLVLYGKNDPQKEEFLALGEQYENITFRVLSDNEDLPHIISGAVASIAVSKEEDFGMVAIESMACGVPVIAVDEGGYRETIVKGKTGFLLPTEGLSNNIITAVHALSVENLNQMRDACVARANDFSLEKFRENLLQYFR